MRLLVRSIIASLPGLRDVVSLFSFCLLAFAIVGVELFRGRLHYRCFDAAQGLAGEPGSVCTCSNVTDPRELAAGRGGCPALCAAGDVCLYTPLNPNNGATSFDHVFDGIFAIVMSVTLEGWSDLMHQLAVAQPWLAYLYFVLLVVFGAFFVMNLYVVVMSESYLSTREHLSLEEHKASIKRRLDKESERRAASQLSSSFKNAKRRKRLRSQLSDAAAALAATLATWLQQAVASLRRRFPGVPCVRQLVGHETFEKLMVGLIIANTLILAIEFHGAAATASYQATLQACNTVFTLAFLVEMMVRIAAYGPVGYAEDLMNVFDAAVVTVSVIELGFTLTSSAAISVNVSGLRTMRLFRAFRIFKAFKVARSFTALRTLLKTVVYSVSEAKDLAFLLLLALFIFALLGMEFFAGTMGTCEAVLNGITGSRGRSIVAGGRSSGASSDASRGAGRGAGSRRPRDECLAKPGHQWAADYESFDDFGSAFMSVLVVFIGENWNSVWHAAFAHSHWLATAYFVVALIVGNLMILNLLLGIIIGSVSVANDEEAGSPAVQSQLARQATTAKLIGLYRAGDGSLEALAAGMPQSADGSGGPATSAATSAEAEANGDAGNGIDPAAAPEALRTRFLQELAPSAIIPPPEVQSAPPAPPSPSPVAVSVPPPEGEEPPKKRVAPADAAAAAAAAAATPSEKPPVESKSLQPLRQMVRRAVEHGSVEAAVLLCIFLSSVSLALDDPRSDRASPFNQALFTLDLVFTSLFTVEALGKIYAYGFIGPRDAYLSSPWNALDLGVVVIGWVSVALAITQVSSGGVNTLRALRTLRPLRLVRRVPAMKLVVGTILTAIPGCATVASVLLFFLIVFAILGMQFFGGTFGQCEDPQYLTLEACRGDGHLWYNPDIGHFDNVLAGTILLFEMMTTEMWPDVLHLMQDAHLPDRAPVPDSSIALARSFCIVWIFVGALFIQNLFVGVVIDRFEQISKDESGRSTLTNEQADWVAAQKQVVAARAMRRPARPNKDTHPRRTKVYDVVMSASFDRFVMIATVLNALLLAVVYHDEPAALELVTSAANVGFAALWTAEAVAKIVAYSAPTYFSIGWNRFDFSLVVAGLFEVLFLAVALGSSGHRLPGIETLLTICRLTRLLRLMKVVHAIPPLRNLLHTLVQSLPSLGAISSLMVLVFFVYGLLGVQLFYNVAHGEFINENVNFETLPVAMLTLLAAATGESWNGMMHDLMVRPGGVDWLTAATGGLPRLPACGLSPGIGEHDCGSWVAVPYFVSFQLVTFCLLLNAAIAVLLAHFTQGEAEEASFISRDAIDSFIKEWSNYDPTARRLISVRHLPIILRRLPAPLGVKGNRKSCALMKVLHKLSEGAEPLPKLRVYPGGVISFHETLMALAGRHYLAATQGIGDTRFAKNHAAEMRAAMRVLTPTTLGTRRMLTGRALRREAAGLKPLPFKASEAEAPAGNRRDASSKAPPVSATVMEAYAAEVVQAALRGALVRREAKAGRLGHSAATVTAPGGSATAGSASGHGKRRLTPLRIPTPAQSRNSTPKGKRAPSSDVGSDGPVIQGANRRGEYNTVRV